MSTVENEYPDVVGIAAVPAVAPFEQPLGERLERALELL